MSDRDELLKEALEIIWYANQGYFIQDRATEFMKKLKYDYYNREKWALNAHVETTRSKESLK